MEKYLYAYNIFTFICLIISGVIFYLNSKLEESRDFSRTEKLFLCFSVFTFVTTVLFSFPFSIWKEVGVDLLMFIGFLVGLSFLESIPAIFSSGWRTLTRKNDDWEFLQVLFINLCMVGYLYGLYRLDTYLNPRQEDDKVTIGELASSMNEGLNNTAENFLLPMTVILIVFSFLILIFKKKKNKALT